MRNAEALGFPALNPVLPQLLRWVQDINWPVAPTTAKLLSTAGPEIAPHIIGVLRSDDDIWKWSILREIAGDLRPDVWSLIGPDVERIATNPTAREVVEEADQAAQRAIGLQASRGFAA